MLQSIRDRAQGWIAWVIVILITIPFALWGIQEYLGVNEPPVVAKIDDKKISRSEFQYYYQMQYQRLQSIFGENFNPDMFNEQRLKQGVLEGLIEKNVLSQHLYDEDYRLGDQQLVGHIRAIPQFHKDGEFSNVTYEQVLSSQGQTSSRFESEMRQDLIVEQFRQSIMQSEFVTNKQLTNSVGLQQQQRDIGYMLFEPKTYFEKVTVSDDELKQHYERNSDRFKTDEKVSIEFVELELKKLVGQATISPDEIKAYYDEHKDLYVAPEQRRASHILISLNKDADESTIKKANDDLKKIRDELAKGKGFTSLAKEYSQDPGSAKNGGDLGFFTKGMMTKSFEDAVFTLDKGEVSNVVKTEFGLHLIKLTDIKKAESKPLNMVSAQIKAELARKKVEKQFYDMTEQLANISYEQPDSLEPVKDALGLEIKRSGLFSRGVAKGVMANPKVQEAIFSKEVLKEGYNSQAIEIDPEHYVVVRLYSHKPASIRKFAEVKKEIEQQIKLTKARQKAYTAASETMEKLSDESSIESLKKKNAATWTRVGYVERNSDKLPPQIRENAFAMAKPGKEPSQTLVEMPSGAAAVLVVYNVKDSNVDLQEKDKKKISDRLVGQYGQAAFSMLVKDISNNYSIERYPNNM